jgi:hypothetical protein
MPLLLLSVVPMVPPKPTPGEVRQTSLHDLSVIRVAPSLVLSLVVVAFFVACFVASLCR